ncbi:MAG: hypothetical protein IRY90_09610 [Actinomadura rubrobrunea]|nr:hypothetical protein [Actinomadura rubrobrunea]
MPEKRVNGGFVACVIIGLLALISAVGIQFLNVLTGGDDSRDPRQVGELGNFTIVCAIAGLGLILMGIGLQIGALAKDGASAAVPGRPAVPPYPQVPQQPYVQQPQVHYPQYQGAPSQQGQHQPSGPQPQGQHAQQPAGQQAQSQQEPRQGQTES